MGWQGWLRRWDRHNDAVLAGEIPTSARERWQWERGIDGDGEEFLKFRVVLLDKSGVRGRVFRRRFWSWEQVVYLTWDTVGSGSALSVCVLGDPYVRSLGAGRTVIQCRALLEDARQFVEAHGSRVRPDLEAASLWWAHDPKSDRAQN